MVEKALICTMVVVGDSEVTITSEQIKKEECLRHLKIGLACALVLCLVLGSILAIFLIQDELGDDGNLHISKLFVNKVAFKTTLISDYDNDSNESPQGRTASTTTTTLSEPSVTLTTTTTTTTTTISTTTSTSATKLSKLLVTAGGSTVSEVIDLENPSVTCSNLDDYPVDGITHAVGGLLGPNIIMICSGKCSSGTPYECPASRKCYKLGTSEVTSLIEYQLYFRFNLCLSIQRS